MSCKVFSYLLSVLLIAQIPINGISAGTDDNEIDNAPEYYLLQGVKVYPADLPLRPAPCEQHLGICMDTCAEYLQRPGTDCQGGQVCCVLV